MTDKNICVSIITATYNSEKTIKDTLDSVLNQTYTNIQYTVVDGASTDRTLQLLNEYKDKFRKRDIQYQIISEKDNGMYDAINKGIKMSEGIIIGNINSDDWYEPDAIENVVKEYQMSHFDMAYGNLNIVRKNSIKVKRARFRVYVTSRDWNHPTTFITKDTYNKYLYKCQNMYDDFDLMLRIRKSGRKLVVINKVLANFRFGGMSTQKSMKSTFERIRIRYHIYENNGYSRLYLLECIVTEFVKYLMA